MPFGLIFGSVFYGLLCLWLGVRFLMSSWLPLRVMGALLVALGVSMSLGLLLRQSWARWVGVAVAVLLPGWLVISVPEAVLVYVIFLAGLTTALLLVIPATGNVHRGLPEGATPRRRAGTVLGPTVAATLLGFLAVLVWAWNAPAPPSRSSRQASSIWTPGGPVSWSEFGPGLELAKREDKPVFVDF